MRDRVVEPGLERSERNGPERLRVRELRRDGRDALVDGGEPAGQLVRAALTRLRLANGRLDPIDAAGHGLDGPCDVLHARGQVVDRERRRVRQRRESVADVLDDGLDP